MTASHIRALSMLTRVVGRHAPPTTGLTMGKQQMMTFHATSRVAPTPVTVAAVLSTSHPPPHPARSFSVAGSGEGRGGGAGGSIKSAGGATGQKAHAQEEVYFRKEDERKWKDIEQTINNMRKAKLDFHRKQRDRHLDKIKKHEALFSRDSDASHKVFIESHKEAADAHNQLIKKMDKIVEL